MDGTRSWDVGGEDDEYNTELIVHNFHPSLTKQGLRSQFLRFGYVESSNVTTNSRGHPVGFVRMRSAGECARAIAGLNGRAPLHWTVKMGLPPAERQRQRQRRDEARRFELETQPQTEACLREMEKVRQKMLQLTSESPVSHSQEFCDTLEVGSEQQGQASEHTEQQHTPPTTGPGTAPTASHLSEQGLALCSVCGAVTAGYCSHCRQPYCSAACQRMDWEAHKPRCRPDLVVSVDSSSEEEQVRSVRLARGDQPASDRAPAPLRRPRATTGQARAASRGSGDERTLAANPPPRQKVQQGSPQQRGRQLYHHQQQRSPLQQQQSHPSPLHQQSPQQQQQPIPQAQQQHSPQQIPQAQQQHSPQQIPQAQQQQQGQGQEPGAEERRRRLRQQQLLLLKRQKQRQQQQQREPQLGPVSLRPGQHYQVSRGEQTSC
ncbi:hypothetical protein FJT64_012688 [Amphibalanus amphitrite]|uniref:Uncharacterized protein n=1 Tax=Amphibalanus amphitrite TaxID=1232801 RepID=A0A6A4VHN8_AMPAM|nr:hypothetical protein FJT64_012688 [Amphibalanus amphitrite]